MLAAQELRDRHAQVVIVLGGDGTHRDVVKGWRDATLIAVSTGTNNVFPRAVEATLAGHAAGAVASARVDARHVSWRAKVIDVEVRRSGAPSSGDPSADPSTDPDVESDPTAAAPAGGELGVGALAAASPGEVARDLALVDLAFVANQHIGSQRGVGPVEPPELVCTIAEPASVGPLRDRCSGAAVWGARARWRPRAARHGPKLDGHVAAVVARADRTRPVRRRQCSREPSASPPASRSASTPPAAAC